MTCGKCIMIKILSYIYLPFMKKQCFGKKVFFYCYLKKQEKNHWWSFQVDELIPTRFVTEDIAFKVIMVMLNLLLQKPLWKSKSKVHVSELERRMNLWEPWVRTIRVTRRSWNISEMSKDYQYNINHQWNIEEIQSRNERSP